MQFDLEQLRLIQRAVRYSISHLHVQADIAKGEGRTAEARASLVEAEKLSELKDHIHTEVINGRIRQGRSTC